MNPILIAAIISAVAMILGPTIGALISRRRQGSHSDLGPALPREGQVTELSAPMPSDYGEARRNYLSSELPELKRLLDGPDSELTLLEREFALEMELIEELELADIRTDLLGADSIFELRQCLFRIQEFLSKHPAHAEGLELQSQIKEAIHLSRSLKIFTFLQLLLFLFVLIRAIGEKIAKKRVAKQSDSPRSKGFGLLRVCR